ncbi:hypothetical protein BX600DRAFT_206112 [Xylariales sp. PMI_506]|nr:hypothetical protein BX600DRAFT_206112 [Xylariales sp. PMI_506]
MPSPLMKATIQAAALSSASNVLSQILDAYNKELPFTFDGMHFMRFLILSFITTPPNYVWQQWLERTFPAHGTPAHAAKGDLEAQQVRKEKDERGPDGQQQQQKPKLNLRNTLSKWFIDCITLGALMNTVAFYILMGLLKGQGAEQIGHNIRTQTIPLIVAGYKIWPLASIISFSFVPVERRIVFLSFIGLLWGIYMSLVAARV